MTSVLFQLFGYGFVGWSQGILFTVEVGVIYYTYFKTGFMSAGRVQHGWVWKYLFNNFRNIYQYFLKRSPTSD